MKARRCPICGGEPQFVHYAIPQYKYPDGWEFGETGLEPIILYKRVECKDCMATNCGLVMRCDDAIRLWNEEHIYQFIFNEPISDVEEE